MLRIRRVAHLLESLATTEADVARVIESASDYYEELLLCDPQKPDKRRIVLNVKGEMRRLQHRMYRRVLLPKLKPSEYSHGGVRGRSIKTNAEPHLRSQFLYKTDISDFYPSIHRKRVYRLFTETLECSPDVARICTQICTYRHQLALGLITSPVLADLIMRTVDRRIGSACEKMGLTYTRYVDDISVSGPFNLEKKRSGVPQLVQNILAAHGFEENLGKRAFGRFQDVTVTGLRELDGHLDVRREYVDELVRLLTDAASLARDEEFDGPYCAPNQILGRVRFVCWVNARRRPELIRRYRSIKWALVESNALKRGYIANVTKLKKCESRENSV